MQLFALQDVFWWTGVVWLLVDVFISYLDSHSDGTHSLQKIHWWATSSDAETNSSIYILNNIFSKVHFQQIVILGEPFL